MERDQGDLRQQMLAALPHVRRFAISLSRNEADGDDLLQTTVERVLTRATPEGVDMKKWMFRICKNIWIDEIRARQVRSRAADNQDITIHDTANSEDKIMNRLKLAKVQMAMTELPDEQRLVLSLVAIEGLSYKDAASVLGTPIGTVMSRLARARKNLAARFAPDPDSTPFSTKDAFRA
ncbi:MAG: RNA polymerase subunit sigma-70 [Robiginitomaculum sp.]|nr:MAG: RNA polymerase subunit sigma-70 [Robiginitomaculum sp.]